MSFVPQQLGTFLRRREEWITVDDSVTYKRARVQLHGKGIVVRDRIEGSMVRTKKQQVARAGQFLVAEIDAKVGGFGIVPPDLDEAVVSSHYFLFDVDESKCLKGWLDAYVRSGLLEDQVMAKGTTNYAAIRPQHVADFEIPLPPLPKQRRIVEKIDRLASRLSEARSLRGEQEKEIASMLVSVFWRLVQEAPRKPMGEVAPLVRRPVEVQLTESYPELGIRSFGRGTFHKQALSGTDVGSKRLYRIEPGDLLFNNVFAWEGAIAVAKTEDEGRFGSHRFITCLPKRGVATSDFLRFYFLTEEGLEQLRTASPGGAGRNRTLGLESLQNIQVPVPPWDGQTSFDGLQAKVHGLRKLQSETAAELDALLPSILDKAFNGEL